MDSINPLDDLIDTLRSYGYTAEAVRFIRDHPELMEEEAVTHLEQKLFHLRESGDWRVDSYNTALTLIETCQKYDIEWVALRLQQDDEAELLERPSLLFKIENLLALEAEAGPRSQTRRLPVRLWPLAGRAVRCHSREDLRQATYRWKRIFEHSAFASADADVQRLAHYDAGIANLASNETGLLAVHLERSITLLTEAAAGEMKGIPAATAAAYALLLRYRPETNAGEDLDNAIDLFTRATELPAEATPLDRSLRLANLGYALLVRFRVNDEVHDLQRALELFKAAQETAAQDAHYFPALLAHRAEALYHHYLLTQDDAAWNAANDHAAAHVRTIDLLRYPLPHADINNIAGQLLLARLDKIEDEDERLATLNRAIQHFDHIARVVATDTRRLTQYLANAGTTRLQRFEITGEKEDLERGLFHLRETVSMTSEDPTVHIIYHDSYMSSLRNYKDDIERLLTRDAEEDA